MVCQAVEERSGKPLISEDLQPAAKLQVRGDQKTSLQIALGEGLEEQPGAMSAPKPKKMPSERSCTPLNLLLTLSVDIHLGAVRLDRISFSHND